MIASEAWRKAIALRASSVVRVPTPPEVNALGGPWNYPFIALLPDGTLNPFAAEQFLAADLGAQLEAGWTVPDGSAAGASSPVTVTAASVVEMLGKELVTGSIAEGATSAEWLDAYVDLVNDWIAVTRGEEFTRILHADVVQAAVVRAIAGAYQV